MRFKRAIIATAAVAVALGVGPASWASAEEQSATDVINSLRSQGVSVDVNRTGTLPMSQCVVTDVSSRRVITQGVPVGNNDRGVMGLVPARVTRQFATVTVDCTEPEEPDTAAGS